MVPDYIPSPGPSFPPSTSPTTSATSTPSASKGPQSDSSRTSGGSTSQLALIVVASVVGGLSLGTCALAFLVVRQRRQARKNIERIEMSLPPPQNYGAYQPIGFFNTSVSPEEESSRKRTSMILEQRMSTRQSAENWVISVKDLKVECEIGRGAFGVVHKGRWQGIEVAIKQLILDHGNLDETKVQDFFGEAELMMKLKGHPNITQLLGICFEPICLVTEYVDNGGLKKWLASEQVMDEALQVRIARDIAAGTKRMVLKLTETGMLYLHKEGIIHRDLAARNILLDSKMRAKVSDFGMSRIVIDQSDSNKTGANVGPIRWMAPEAMRQRIYNNKTDIWSYGVVLYEIMTRKIPYNDAELIHIATSVALGELSLIPEIEKEGHKYPSALVKIFKMCLQRDPQDRPLFEEIIDIFDQSN